MKSRTMFLQKLSGINGFKHKCVIRKMVHLIVACSLCFSLNSAFAVDQAQVQVGQAQASSGTFEKVQIIEAEKIAQSDTGPTDSTDSSNINQARLSPKDALKRLLEGNKRFMNNEIDCPEKALLRRAATIEQQRPFAIVLGCSDSRTPPEKVFNQGIGDVFVVRIAGNVVGILETESVEFAANTFGSSIIVVMGHQNCGAVDAAMKGQTQGVPELGRLIKPAFTRLNGKNPTLEEAIIANVKNSVESIKKAKGVAPLIKAGKIGIVGAYYDFTTGEARIVQDLDQKAGS